MTELPAADRTLDSVRSLLGRIGRKAVRQRLHKIMVLWDMGYLREALTQFRVTAEEALRQITAHLAPTDDRHQLEGKLEQGQCAAVIEKLYRGAEVIPARVALHLHTLLAWGNYASHHQKKDHHARPTDLAVLISVAVDLEDWISTQCVGGGSIFDAEDLAWAVHQAEERTIKSGLDRNIARTFVSTAGSGVQADPHRLVAPHLSLEVIWRIPDAPADPPGPYRGLQAFDPEDAHRFYGRDQIRGKLERGVDTKRLTIVSGASGTGKTSLLRAGLIPALVELGCGVVLLSEYGQRGVQTVEALVEQWPSSPLVVIFDQFERALLSSDGPDLLHGLMKIVLQTGMFHQGRRVVIGIREDYLGRLLREARSRSDDGVLQQEDALVVVGPLDRKETREAVVRPLEGAGISFDDQLVEEVLLPELAEMSGTSPARLQIVCGRLYREAQRQEVEVIDRALYDQLGGVDRILGRYLDETLSGYDDQQELARALLKSMTGPDARRWVDLGEGWQALRPALQHTDEVQIQAVLSRLLDDRLVAARSSGAGAPVQYSLMHDKLGQVVRQWTSAVELEIQQAQEHLDRTLAAWSDPVQREPLRGRALKLVERHWSSLRKSRRDRAAPLLLASRRGRLVRRSSVGLLLGLALLSLVFGVVQLRRAILSGARAQAAADQGVLLQARLELDLDPSKSVAWLRNLSPSSSGVGVLTLVEEARRRGVANILEGHQHLVTAVSFSPDGKTLASASRDRSIRLWDVATNRAIGRPLSGHTDYVSCVAFSPDGKLLASASWDGSIRLWDPRRRRRALVRHDHRGAYVYWLAFSPDGRTLASVDGDGFLLLWDVNGRRLRGQPATGHTSGVLTVAFSPDGKLLATGSLDQTVRLWRSATGAAIEPPLTGHGRGVFAVAFSPDGATLASASRDHTVRLWDVPGGAPRGMPLTGHRDGVLTISFSPDGRTLASAGADKVVRLWDLPSGRLRGPPLRGHQGLIHDLDFSPDGKLLASASRDHTVRMWDVISRRSGGFRLRGHRREVLDVSFSPDGKLLASASRDRTVRLWDAESRAPSGAPLDHEAVVLSTAFSPDGHWIATGDAAGKVRLWGKGEKTQHTLGAQGKEVHSVMFSPDGKLLASASDNGQLQLWDLASRRPGGPTLPTQSGAISSLAFTPDSATLASGGHDGVVQLWNLGDLRPAGRPLKQQSGAIYALAISPDGKTLASGGGDAAIQLWQLPAGQPRGGPLRGHRHWVLSVAFSGDGETVASGSSDGTVRLWSARTGEPLGPPLRGHTDWVNAVAFAPDGNTLASGSSDRTVWLWQLSAAKLSRLEQIIDNMTNLHVHLDGRVEVQ